MKCWLCRFGRNSLSVGTAHMSDEDRGSMEPAVYRRAPGRHYDQPSRADRNRIRRTAHETGCAWLIYRTEDKAARWGKRREVSP